MRPAKSGGRSRLASTTIFAVHDHRFDLVQIEIVEQAQSRPAPCAGQP
jgi:hypothetical protein